MPQLFRSSALASYVEVASQAGIDPYAQLAAAGIDPEVLGGYAKPVAAAAVQALFERSSAAAGADDFGLRMGIRYQSRFMGAIGLVAEEQPTALDALKVIRRYIVLNVPLIAARVDEQGDTVVTRFDLGGPGYRPSHQGIDYVKGVEIALVRALAGRAVIPEQVSLARPRPRDTSLYRSVFGRVAFDCAESSITYRATDLREPRPASDASLVESLTRLLDTDLDSRTGRPGGPFSDMVRARLESGRCTSEAIASDLRIGPRALQRRLAAHGVTLAEIVEDVRVESAQEMLLARQPIKRISGALGFADQSSFSRWFSTRFGEPPSRWRSAAPERASRQA